MHLVANTRQQWCILAGAAADLQNRSIAPIGQDRARDDLIEITRQIAIGVVGRRPLRIRRLDIHVIGAPAHVSRACQMYVSERQPPSMPSTAPEVHPEPGGRAVSDESLLGRKRSELSISSVMGKTELKKLAMLYVILDGRT